MGRVTENNAFEYVPFQKVSINDKFWSKRIEATYKNTLPAILAQLKATGRWEAFSLKWKPGDPNPPHIFWDSDTAKYLEAASYALAKKYDPALRYQLEQQIDWIRTSQWDDGYINSYFTLMEPHNRFTNLKDRHELYCCGHLLEAAIAHYKVTQNTKFLNAMIRYVKLIQTTFGPDKGQLHGYPGHEELELALMKLYATTRAPEHLQLARYFVEERGQRRDGVHFYEWEAEQRGDSPEGWFEYHQAGKPIREQPALEGHAVRAMYFLSGAADVALEVNDTTLLAAVARQYREMVEKKMYVTYGIGSVPQWEGFGPPYDLPNDSAYCETCASIGVVLLCHRLLKWDWDVLAEHSLIAGEIADVMEGALYNAVGAGVGIDGKRFFYANALETHGGNTHRDEWFPTSCCPPNVARLFCSLGEYQFLIKRHKTSGIPRVTVAVLLYINSEAVINVHGRKVKIKVQTGWPWSGNTSVQFENAHDVEIELLLRNPSWNKLNKSGFTRFPFRRYRSESVQFHIPCDIVVIPPHPLVKQNKGRVAIGRGPFIYAMESIDNVFPLNEARITGYDIRQEKISIKGIDVIQLLVPGRAQHNDVTLKFIPYWAWCNRGAGDVLVWCKSD